MSSELKPIMVWGQGGPNPPKAAMILEELGLPHDIIPIPFTDIKKPEYLAVNPNGRIPAIQDPNTNLTLWESGAILEYIIEHYDTENKFSFPADTSEYYLCKQWMYFQTSGQGPYYGQLAWFRKFHSEKVPSAEERYAKEVNRVTGVLETHLSKQKVEEGSEGPWLVGGKYTYADLAFIPWQVMMTRAFLQEDEFKEENYPNVKRWLDNMMKRPAVKKVMDVALQPH